MEINKAYLAYHLSTSQKVCMNLLNRESQTFQNEKGMEVKSVNSLLNPSISFSLKVSIVSLLFIEHMRGLCLLLNEILQFFFTLGKGGEGEMISTSVFYSSVMGELQ